MPQAAARIQQAAQRQQSLVLDSNGYNRVNAVAQGGNQENHLIGTETKVTGIRRPNIEVAIRSPKRRECRFRRVNRFGSKCACSLLKTLCQNLRRVPNLRLGIDCDENDPHNRGNEPNADENLSGLRKAGTLHTHNFGVGNGVDPAAAWVSEAE